MSGLKRFAEHGPRVIGTEKKLFRQLGSTKAELFDRDGVFNAGFMDFAVLNPCCKVNRICTKW